MSNIAEQAAQIRTPLALAALSLLLLGFLYREIIRHAAGPKSANARLIIRGTFILALVAVIFGFGAYAATLFLKYRPTVSVYGRVFDAGSETAGIPDALVSLQLDMVSQQKAQQTGAFSFLLPRSAVGRQIEVWASADGYQNSPMQRITLTDRPTTINLPLVREAISENPSSNPNCLAGTWEEMPNGQFSWTVVARGPTVSIKRADGWAVADLHYTSTGWVGTLNWGNGLQWANFTLMPNKSCRKMTTNKDWWYFRR